MLQLWNPEEVFRSCLPPAAISPLFLPQLLLRFGNLCTGLELTQPGLLRSVFPVVHTRAERKPSSLVAVASYSGSQREEGEKRGTPLVVIYNTHTGETYALTDGVERVAGRGKVVRVAAILAKGLSRREVKVVRSEKIHDTHYATSYLESEKTVRELIYSLPEVTALFDVHRDSRQPQGAATVKIGGREVARVLIVVGSDARQPFPTWRENLAFARRIAARADCLYPGLCAGVRVKEGRYNQFLHPRALLLEIGGVNNTFREAQAAAELFADVLADVVWEEYRQEHGSPGSSGGG